MKQQTIATLLTFLAQLKVNHWQTYSYSRHSAFGTTYSILDSLVDSYVEKCSAVHDRPELDGTTIILVDLDAANFLSQAKAFDTFLCALESEYKDYSDILNILADMRGAVHQLQYLLTLE